MLPAADDVQLSIFTRNKEQNEETLREIVAFVGEPDSPADPAEWLDWPAPALEEITPAEQEITLVFDGDDESGTMQWTINGEVWDWAEGDAFDDFITVTADTPTRFVVQNDSPYVHPFHLHGNFLQMVSRAGEPPDYAFRFDTLMIEQEQEVEMFGTLPNPGIWMAHCHILEHAALGMMTAINVVDQR